MNLIKILWPLFFSLNVLALTLEEERKYDELEGHSYLKKLVDDKKFQEAIDYYPILIKQKEEVGSFLETLGDAYQGKNDWQNAFKNYQKSEKKISTKPLSLSLSLAKASYKLKKYDTCSDYYSQISPLNLTAHDWPYYFTCLEKNEQSEKALKLSVDSVQDLMPEALLTKIKFLLDLQLVEMAKNKFWQQSETCYPENFYARLWVKWNKILPSDNSILEVAHSCHPTSASLSGLFVKDLFARNQAQSIAIIFDLLSKEDSNYLYHAAEFYQAAHQKKGSEYFYFLQADQGKYVLSLTSDFLQKELYSFMAVFRPSAQEKKNQDLLYASSFAKFKYGKLSEALDPLKGIGTLPPKFTTLATMINLCKKQDWKCRP